MCCRRALLARPSSVTRQLHHARHAGTGARVGAEMTIDVFAERRESRPDHADDAIGVPTGPTAIDGVQALLEAAQVSGVRPPAGQEAYVIGDGGQAERARTALSCAFACHPGRDPCRLQ